MYAYILNLFKNVTNLNPVILAVSNPPHPHVRGSQAITTVKIKWKLG